MCGIGAIILKNNNNNLKGRTFKKMLKTIEHRGPDDEGFLLFSNNNNLNHYAGNDTDLNVKNKLGLNLFENNQELSKVNLGFRRLSIIDTSYLGHQPMSYKNGRYWIIFNGEIYNYIEIKKNLLEKGYEFKSNSDTEVIMAAYDFYGEDCFNTFNGMWSFIILDTHKNEIIAARDRFGIKPLYYYLDNNVLTFASEIKQFLEIDGLNIKPNATKIKEDLDFDTREYLKETSFTNVYRFPKAHFLKLQINKVDNIGDLTFKKYYNLEFNDQDEDFNEAKAKEYSEEYYRLLQDSVALRLRSDVPIGTCFSGGLDSSSVVYFMNKILKEKDSTKLQNAFSLVFNESETKYCDESQYIDYVAKKLNIHSHKIEPKTIDVINNYQKMIFAMDTPQSFNLMSYIFTYKLVRESGVIVTLDGQGADELQAGYLPYFRNFFINDGFLKATKKVINNCNTMTGANKEITNGYIFGLIKNLNLNKPFEQYLKNKKLQSPFKTLNEKLFEDFNQNLETLFHFGDRGSMINSVEARFPIMDYRIVEFWMKMPSIYKIHNGYTKYIARTAMNNKLPNEVTWRKDKMGWETPQKEWIKNGLGDIIKNELSNSTFLKELCINIDPNSINSNSLDKKFWKNIIKIYNLALWHKTFFNEK